jgi:hypothetical protein
MAINRGTRKENFIHILESFAVLGTIAGAGFGIYQTLGKAGGVMLVSAFKLGFAGFIAGSIIGIIAGALAVILITIFR